MQTVRNGGHRRGSFWRYSRRASCEAARQLLTHHVDLLRNFAQRSTLNRTASPDL